MALNLVMLALGQFLPGVFQGRDVTIVDVFEGVGKHAARKMSDSCSTSRLNSARKRRALSRCAVRQACLISRAGGCMLTTSAEPG